MAEIHRLGPAFDRTDLTPDQAILSSRAYDWERVIVAGFVKEHGSLIVRTSSMTRADALWIVEHLKKHVLGDLD
jgi:hypothetical protein